MWLAHHTHTHKHTYTHTLAHAHSRHTRTHTPGAKTAYRKNTAGREHRSVHAFACIHACMCVCVSHTGLKVRPQDARSVGVTLPPQRVVRSVRARMLQEVEEEQREEDRNTIDVSTGPGTGAGEFTGQAMCLSLCAIDVCTTCTGPAVGAGEYTAQCLCHCELSMCQRGLLWALMSL